MRHAVPGRSAFGGGREVVAYRSYLICWSIFTLDKTDSRFWVEKNGQHICWANTFEDAKRKIDEVIS